MRYIITSAIFMVCTLLPVRQACVNTFSWILKMLRRQLQENHDDDQDGVPCPFYVPNQLAIVPYHSAPSPDDMVIFQEVDALLVLSGAVSLEAEHGREVVSALNRLPGTWAGCLGSRVSIVVKVTGQCPVHDKQAQDYTGYTVVDGNAKETVLLVKKDISDVKLPGDFWMLREHLGQMNISGSSLLNSGDCLMISGAKWSLCENTSGAGLMFCLQVDSSESCVVVPNALLTNDIVKLVVLALLCELQARANSVGCVFVHSACAKV